MAIKIPIVTAFDNKGLKQAQSQFDKFGSAIKKGLRVAAISAAAVTAIGMVAARFAKMAEEAEVANRKLEQVASQMGVFGDQTTAVVDRLKAYADANKFVLGVDDEVIKSTQAKLLTFEKLAASADTAGGAFDRATTAAFDLAAMGFGSAESNAIKLGKALNDPIANVNALSRAGVQFTDGEKNLIESLVKSNDLLGAQEIILGKVEAKVGGAAEATATSSKKMSIAFGEIGEAIGYSVLPMFDAFASWIVEITPSIETFFSNLTDPTTDVGQAWLNMSGAVVTFGETFVSVFGQIEGSKIFMFLADLLQTIFIGLSEIVWVAGDAGDTLGKLFSGDFAGAGKNIGSFFDRYNKFVDGLYNKIDARAAEFGNKFTKPIVPKIQFDSGGNFDGGQGAKPTKSPAAQEMDTLVAKLKLDAKKIKKQGELIGAGLSEGLAKAILANKNPIKAANFVLNKILETGGKYAKKLMKLWEDSQQGITATPTAEAANAAATAAAEGNKTIIEAIKDLLALFKPAKKEVGVFQQQIIDSFEAIMESIRNRGFSRRKTTQYLGIATFVQQQMEIIAKKRDEIASKIEKSKSFMSSVIDSLLAPMDITKLGKTTSAIINSLKTQIDKTLTFRKQIQDLSAAGLSTTAIQQIVQAGAIEGGDTARAILAGGPEAVNQINALYSELGTTAESFAETAATALYGAGVDISNGLIAGLMAQDTALQQAATTLGNSFANYFKRAFGMSLRPETMDIVASGATRAGTVINLTVTAPYGSRAQDFGRLIVQAISDFERQSGQVFVRA